MTSSQLPFLFKKVFLVLVRRELSETTIGARQLALMPSEVLLCICSQAIQLAHRHPHWFCTGIASCLVSGAGLGLDYSKVTQWEQEEQQEGHLYTNRWDM